MFYITLEWPSISRVLELPSIYFRLGGFLSFDIDITSEDVNQCDKTSGQINVFLHTHKCHQESSEVRIQTSK